MRRWNSKPVSDYLPKFNISKLKRFGLFADRDTLLAFRWGNGPDWASRLRVSIYKDWDNEEYAKVGFWYRYIDPSGEEHSAQFFDLASTTCNFGGKRYWFICDCFRRVGTLYYYNGRFACCHCLNLTYASRNLSGRWKAAGTIISAPDLQEYEDRVKRRYYRGKITAPYARYLRKYGRFCTVLSKNVLALETMHKGH